MYADREYIIIIIVYDSDISYYNKYCYHTCDVLMLW